MRRQILHDVEAFAFVGSLGRRLELHGSLVSWSDKLTLGVVEHLVMKRDGALHQNVGAHPRVFSFACVMLGREVTTRYKALLEMLSEDPQGTLTHPRLGSLPAVCREVSAAEKPADEIDTVRFVLEFVETGLQSKSQPSGVALAASAVEVATQLVLASGQDPNMQAVRQAVVQYADQVTGVALGHGSLRDLSQAQAGVHRLLEVAVPLSAPYRIRGLAIQVRYGLQAAWQAVQRGKPAWIPIRVPTGMSLPRLCATLYGATHARAVAEEARRMYRMPGPHYLPAGTLLFLPDPEQIKHHAR